MFASFVWIRFSLHKTLQNQNYTFHQNHIVQVAIASASLWPQARTAKSPICVVFSYSVFGDPCCKERYGSVRKYTHMYIYINIYRDIYIHTHLLDMLLCAISKYVKIRLSSMWNNMVWYVYYVYYVYIQRHRYSYNIYKYIICHKWSRSHVRHEWYMYLKVCLKNMCIM